MLKSILKSFAWSYGRQMGRNAARRTSWLALPLLILVVIVGLLELFGGGLGLTRLLPFLAGAW